MIAIVDYGVGNLFSLQCSLGVLGQETVVTGDPGILRDADRILLPGVGAFGDAVDKLRAKGLDKVLLQTVEDGKPLLGICLGMQMLFEESHEYGKHIGLGLIPGQVIPFQGKLPDDYKIPHMGWNALTFRRSDCPLLANSREGDYVYFVHSFYGSDCDESLAATAFYGVEVPAIVQKRRVYGCQFHPEKSGRVGLGILKAFCENG